MLVACILVNRATWEVAEPAFNLITWLWPTPEKLARCHGCKLMFHVQQLGLQTQRAKHIRALAKAWTLGPKPETAEDVMGLPGCGKYAADSWAIFVEGRTDVYPEDGKLTWYVKEQSR